MLLFRALLSNALVLPLGTIFNFKKLGFEWKTFNFCDNSLSPSFSTLLAYIVPKNQVVGKVELNSCKTVFVCARAHSLACA